MRPNALIGCLLLWLALLAAPHGLWGAPATNTPTITPTLVPSLNPQGKILLIVGACSNSSGLTMVAHIQETLKYVTPSPVIDFIVVPCVAAANGIYTTLGTKKLTDYCQVWDLRLEPGNPPNANWDTITLTGANNDKALYDAFLLSGGSLYLVGENASVPNRNTNLITLLNGWSNNGSIPYPSTRANGFRFFTFPPLPVPFQGSPMTLPYRYTADPGYVKLGQTGSGRPVLTQYVDATIGTIVGAFAFLPQDLTLGAGRVFVDLDWTSWGSAWNDSAADNDSMVAWAININHWMGNCYYRFNVTKAASVVPPSTVCIGQNFNYLLCVNNIGSNALAAGTILDDTFPGCLTYQSAVPAYNTKTGQYIAWLAGAVPAGSSYCVTVTVKATSLPPCP